MGIPACASLNEAEECVDAVPIGVRRIAIEIEIVPRAPLADQSPTLDREHGFAKYIGFVVATAVYALASVLGDVLSSTFTGFAKPNVNDVRITSEFVPGVRQPRLREPRSFCEHVQVGVPAVVAAATLDLNEVHATNLRLSPRGPPAELDERRVKSIDILLERPSRLAQGERYESNRALAAVTGDATSDVPGSLLCAGIAESILAFVAGDAVHAWLTVRLKHPGFRAAPFESGKSVGGVVHRSQGCSYATASVFPTGVSEGDPGFVVGLL